MNPIRILIIRLLASEKRVLEIIKKYGECSIPILNDTCFVITYQKSEGEVDETKK